MTQPISIFYGSRGFIALQPEGNYPYPMGTKTAAGTILYPISTPPTFLTGSQVTPSLLAGYFDPPQWDSSEGWQQGESAASPFGLYQTPGIREVHFETTIRLAGTLNLLTYAVRTPDTQALASSTTLNGITYYSSWGGLIDSCALLGMYADNGATPLFYTTLMRYCKLNRTSFIIEQSAQGQAAEFTANCQFMGLTQQATDPNNVTGSWPHVSVIPSNLSNIDYQAYGMPLTWFNMLSMNIGSTNFAGQIKKLTVNIDHGVTGRGSQPPQGDNYTNSRIRRALIPGDKQSVTGEIEWFGPVSTNLMFNSTEATLWGNIVASMSNATTGGATTSGHSTAVTMTLYSPRPDRSMITPQERNSPYLSRVPFVASNYLVTPTFS